eukprot:5988434-Amphidinium_carterae.1
MDAKCLRTWPTKGAANGLMLKSASLSRVPTRWTAILPSSTCSWIHRSRVRTCFCLPNPAR